MANGSGSVVVIVALLAVSLILTPLTVVELLCDGLAVALANAVGVANIATSPPLGPSPLYGSACTMYPFMTCGLAVQARSAASALSKVILIQCVPPRCVFFFLSASLESLMTPDRDWCMERELE
jgi:hypothetical protein